MKTIFYRYQPFWLGGIITAVATVILSALGVLLINPKHVGENVALFTLWWFIIAFLIYRFKRVKNKQALLIRIGTILSLLGGILLAEDYSDMVDNPISFTLLVAIWLYIFSWVTPVFFQKYRGIILGLYAILLIIFIRGRLSSNDYFAFQEEYIITFFLPIPLFILLWIYEQWKWFRSLQTEKTEAELALLKSQINPHFFFNTLNNLHALTVNQAKEAPDVIVKLSDMMRYTIYEGKKDFVPVGDEVAYLQNYIELHQIRHHNKVVITFVEEVEPGVKVSPLLFIVLLENAFKHGAERLIADAFIDIQLTAKSDLIQFKIRNNFDPDELVKESGIGLSNLGRRLELVYPEQHTLEIDTKDKVYEATLTIEPQHL